MPVDNYGMSIDSRGMSIDNRGMSMAFVPGPLYDGASMRKPNIALMIPLEEARVHRVLLF